MTEIQIQAEMYQWCHNHLPQTRGLLFHVPNGGSRNAVEGMQLKASGVVAGIPDLILLWQGKAYGFEVKTPSGQLSQAQVYIHHTWVKNGVPVQVVRSIEEFKKSVLSIVSEGLAA